MIEFLLLLIISSSVFILVSNHPVYCLFSLIITFINFSILLIYLNLEFLALSYVIVYVGAICVLFIFVILLLNIRIYNLGSNNKTSNWILFLLFFSLILILMQNDINLHQELNFPNNLIDYERDINLYGKSFFSFNWQYLILTVLLLLLAVIATISVSLKKQNNANFKFNFFL